MPVSVKFELIEAASIVKRYGLYWLLTPEIAKTQNVEYRVAGVLQLEFYHHLNNLDILFSKFLFC